MIFRSQRYSAPVLLLRDLNPLYQRLSVRLMYRFYGVNSGHSHTKSYFLTVTINIRKMGIITAIGNETQKQLIVSLFRNKNLKMILVSKQ